LKLFAPETPDDRGVLFSAIDVFSAFGPNEVDREWRRGVDAVHLELRIPGLDALSGDVIAVFGNIESGELESYSVLGRLRAVVGDADGELIVGRRGEDTMVGGALSATVGDAEVHGELALFGTDGAGIDGGLFGTRGVVAKGLLGGADDLSVALAYSQSLRESGAPRRGRLSGGGSGRRASR